MTEQKWVCLFSGGKDSSYAMYDAMKNGYNVEYLLTVFPKDVSYMYHVPHIRLSEKVAEEIDAEHITVSMDGLQITDEHNSEKRGDQESKILRQELKRLKSEKGIEGVVTGAIESSYQKSRISHICEELSLDSYNPLWQRNPEDVAREMLDEGFEIRIIQVAAAGLDKSWLGREMNSNTIDELVKLNEKLDVHILGEGGEFETLVTNGPHMQSPIEISYTKSWNGTRGKVKIKEVS